MKIIHVKQVSSIRISVISVLQQYSLHWYVTKDML